MALEVSQLEQALEEEEKDWLGAIRVAEDMVEVWVWGGQCLCGDV
jgi:hypothetical protein